MAIPAAMAVHLGAPGSMAAFLVAFIATSPLLWTAGYLLNDLSDRDLDRQHGLRRGRPLARGELAPSRAVVAMVAATAAALILGWLLGPKVLLCLVLLGLSQVSYTLRPIRLKERVGLDMGANVLNSVLRSAIGWYSQSESSLAAAGFLVVALALFKLALFLGHRFQNRAFELARGMCSTVTVLAPGAILALVGVALTGSAGALALGVLDGRFPGYALIALLAGSTPLFVHLVFRKGNPSPFQQEDGSSLRNAIYGSMFLMGNLVAWVLVGWPAQRTPVRSAVWVQGVEAPCGSMAGRSGVGR